MSDTSSVRGSVRASTLLNRPQIVPLGPRTRQTSLRVSHLPDHGTAAPATPTSAISPAASSALLPLPHTPTVLEPISDSPETSPHPDHSTPAIVLPDVAMASSPIMNVDEFGIRNSLTAALAPAPAPVQPSPSPSPPSSSQASSDQKTSHFTESSESTSTSASAPAYVREPTPDPTSQRDPEPALEPEPEPRVVPVLQAQKLTPPPAIKFDTKPIPYKSLPLEGALWTFDSKSLQDIVSRAIRSSAKESFIRLLTLENVDMILPAELARLDQLKAVTQAKYRFLVHRRTMLFYALNSTSSKQQKGEEDGVSVVAKLTAQLAETVADCDLRLEEILGINDQIYQINKLMDIHSASALAIALRKLNGSYSRRTKDLIAARDRITQLQHELEDAWKEAENMAKELDDYEDAIEADDTVAIIETAEVVSVPRSPTSPPPDHLIQAMNRNNRRSSIPMPMTPTLLAVKTMGHVSPTPAPTTTPHSSAGVSPQHFVFPPNQVAHPTPPISPRDPNIRQSMTAAVFRPPSGKEANGDAEDGQDAVSIRSTKSTRSMKSTKSGRSTHTRTTSVQAAKTRSRRASQSSLRLHLGSGGKKMSAGGAPSSWHGTLGFEDDVPPPMPELPIQFTSSIGHGSTMHKYTVSQVYSNHSATASSTLFPNEDGPSVPTLRRQASLDTVCTTGKRPGTSVIESSRGRAADDLYIRTPNSSRPNTTYRADDEIQLVPRTPPWTARSFGSVYAYRQPIGSPLFPPESIPPPPPPKDKKTIPAMWMNVDNVKTPNTLNGQLAPPPTSSVISPNGGLPSSFYASSHASRPNSPGPSPGPLSSPNFGTFDTSYADTLGVNIGLGQSSYSSSALDLHPTHASSGSTASGTASDVIASLGLGRHSADSEAADQVGQFPTLPRRTASTTSAYSKIKGLTKRYSQSLPRLHGKLAQRANTIRAGGRRGAAQANGDAS